jgi:hypothetical protein
MIYRNTLRHWASRNLAPLMFLSMYFLTVVVGNIIFTTPFGKAQLEKLSYTAAILEFDTLFSAGYWALLLVPFLVTPIVVTLVRRAMERPLQKTAQRFPEFSKTTYAMIAAACFGYVLFALLKADAFTLFSSGSDALSAVEARFLIRNRAGAAALIILMSILPFLSVYSLIRWMRRDGVFWIAMSVSNTVIMTVFLTVLNMKWPVLVFDIGLVLAVFVYAQRRPYLKAAIGSVMLIAVYLLISTFVWRIAAPALAPAESPRAAKTETASILTTTTSTLTSNSSSPYIVRLAEAAMQSAPMLAIAAVNRMAVAYPYYFEVFSTEGAVCGGILEQARVGPACRPSTFIYTRIFGDDGFQGRGTTPAAVHISGYALGGWPVAIFALICASIILGLFACLPLDMNATIGALAITGGIAGYHFSQVPGEGPLIYDHGVLWVFLTLFLYIMCCWIYDKSKVIQVAGNTTVLHMGYREHVLIKEETAAQRQDRKLRD